jgi:hypothetical protein
MILTECRLVLHARNIVDDRSSNNLISKKKFVGNKSSNRGQGPKDLNQTAYDLVQMVTGQAPMPEPPKNPAAVSLGRLGGLKGGKARADALTPERRAEIAKKAADARWKG